MNTKTKCSRCKATVAATWMWVGDDDRALLTLDHDVDGHVCAGSGELV